MIRHLSFVIRHCLVVLCFSLGACASTPKPVAKPAAPAPAAPVDPVLLATDPCALRMQDIAAAMTVYLAKVPELPPSLTLLKPAAARVGLTLDFTCPLTHRPYIYVPNGLSMPNDPHMLVLYDAAPDSTGQRWAILLSPPAGIHPLTTDIVRLTDPMLMAYLRQHEQ